MTIRSLLVAAGLGLSAMLAGCAQVVLDPAVTEAAARGGCHWDCPPCHPNEPCSLAPCVLECPPGVDPCGPTVCRDGQVCCNESCGICTDPGDFCIELYCAPPERGHFCAVRALCVEGSSWSETACRCLPNSGNPHDCTVDADCRSYSDYCGGCMCDALANSDSDPNCPGDDYVLCFIDPCWNQDAICVEGQCQLAPLETTWIEPI